MANNISKKLEESWKKLPNAINGNGQNFIFLLKTLLGDLKDELDDKFEEISKISNAVTDAPEEMDEQLQNCKIQEVRVGTNISFVLSWDYSNVKNYDSAEIYIKETKGNIADHKNWDEVEVSRTIRTTKTDTVTVDGINAGYIYQITFQAKNTFGSVSRKSGCPVLQYAVSAMNNVPDPPLEFDVYFNRDGVLWTWKQPVNLDYSYSELRTNQDVGNKVGLLEVTQDTKSTVMPPTREGTAYLYNKGYGSKYSTPITKPWSKPIPTAPQAFKAEKTFRGILFTYSKIPEDCIGIVISINGEKHYTQDDTWTYYCSMGNFVVKACYYDIFGEGIWTEESTVAVYTEIDPNWLKNESITLAKVDTTIKDAVKDAQDSVGKINTINGSIAQLEKTDASITSTVAENKKKQDAQNTTFVSQIRQNSDSITSVVTSVEKTNKKVDSNYSAILQNQKDIALRVKADDIINQINISKEGVRIDGNKVHITGDTVFDKGVIVSSYIGDKQVVGTKIADGAIETDKLAANSVTAGKIATNAITADKVSTGAITADKIDTGAVTADKIETGAITADKLTSGAVTADKLAANTINLAGALKIVGGNVTLDENGLAVNSDDGKTLFNGNGMVFTDSSGASYNVVTRSIIGTAKNGQYVRFGSKWPKVPNVIVSPLSMVVSNPGFSQAIITLHSYADQITQEGFYVRCYSGIQSGEGTLAYNRNYYNSKVDMDGYGVTITPPSAGSTSFNAPSNGDKITIRYRVDLNTTHFAGKATVKVITNIYKDGSLIRSSHNVADPIACGWVGRRYGNESSYFHYDYGYGSSSKEFTEIIGLSPNSFIKIESKFESIERRINSSLGDSMGEINISCTMVSATVDIAGEQVLDANGTALFLVTDNASQNYTVS